MAPETLRGPSDEAAAARVVVTGAGGALGRRVLPLLEAAADLGPVVVLDDAVDLTSDDLKPLLEGAEVLVHLATIFGPDLDDPAIDRADDVTAAQRLLDAAGDVGVRHLVLLSSATVYGVWANNAMPLTEAATLRPCPDLAFAVQRAEIERRAGEWRTDHPGTTVTVLRPAPVVGDVDDDAGWLAKALHEARRVADLDGDGPAQFLHVDDLASAVALAAVARLDGARNVAPDGWLRGAEYTALDAGTPKVRPRRVGDRVARLRWRLRLAPTPPALQPYARHPWVIANHALRADGWVPTHANDEAFVDGTPATALATLSPRRRQELALGITGGALVAGLGGAAFALARRARRSS